MKEIGLRISLWFVTMTCLFQIGCIPVKEQNENDLLITANICGKADRIVKTDSINGDYIFINLTVTNTSRTLKSIWIYSCAWMRSWSIEPNSLIFYSEGCDSNYPKKIDLNPGQSISFHGIIHNLNNLIDSTRFRVGFRDFNEIELKSWIPKPNEQKNVNLNPKIYWSEWITLDYLNNSYKISR